MNHPPEQAAAYPDGSTRMDLSFLDAADEPGRATNEPWDSAEAGRVLTEADDMVERDSDGRRPEIQAAVAAAFESLMNRDMSGVRAGATRIGVLAYEHASRGY